MRSQAEQELCFAEQSDAVGALVDAADLQRDGAVMLRIARAPDLALAPAPDQIKEFVAAGHDASDR
jgi:hypothetical protein